MLPVLALLNLMKYRLLLIIAGTGFRVRFRSLIR
jgi:hypothetical protein